MMKRSSAARGANGLAWGVLVIALLTSWPALAQPQPRVVASIAPAHALVAGVMKGVGQPALLVDGAVSPHTYSLRPSEARLLQEATVVFWFGPAMELFLVKPLVSLGRDARVVGLNAVPGVTLLPQRAGGVWEEHAHGNGAHDRDVPDGSEPRDSAYGDVPEHNPHSWLDPVNAQAMVRAIADALVAADPANATAYATNARSLLAEIEALDTELRRRLEPVRHVPFLVFHDAYAYLEQHYGLNAVGAVTVSPEQRAGARRIAALRERLQDAGAACVFAEPQFEPRLLHTLVEGTAVRVGHLDPLGAGLSPGPGLYAALMRDLASGLVACLAPGR